MDTTHRDTLIRSHLISEPTHQATQDPPLLRELTETQAQTIRLRQAKATLQRAIAEMEAALHAVISR